MSEKQQEQTTLFTPEDLPPKKTFIPLNGESPLKATLGFFGQYMEDEGFSLNTRKAFLGDVRLLGKYIGIGQSIGEINTKNLNDFLQWLLEERGVPCSPKTYARRVTTLKVYFAWLEQTGVLYIDPAKAVIQRSVRSPLPNLPTEEQLQKAQAVAIKWRREKLNARHKKDARPYILLNLLLQTAIKKSEATALSPEHIDVSDTNNPIIHIRYKNPRMRYKERKLPLTQDWVDTLDEYRSQYNLTTRFFTCTARNLEYVLSEIGEECGVAQGLLSFEALRWVSSFRDYRSGMEQDKIRQKLGLSKVTWRETRRKLNILLDNEKKDTR